MWNRILCILAGAVLVCGCNSSGSPTNSNDAPQSGSEPPVLSVTPVSIPAVSSMIPFGEMLDSGRRSPAFEYYCNSSSVQVRSSSSGVVKWIRLNSNFPDYAIAVEVSSRWTVHYDHVLNPAVSEGDPVAPGDVLGTVGKKNRTELQVNGGVDGDELSYCPFDFATDDFIEQHKTLADTWCLTGTVVP